MGVSVNYRRFLKFEDHKDTINKMDDVFQEVVSEHPQLAERIIAPQLSTIIKNRYKKIEHQPRSYPRWFTYIKEDFLKLKVADHVFRTKNNIEFHPYDISQKDLEELIAKCKQHGVKYHIDGRSLWFPGSTVRIVLNKEKEAARGRQDPPAKLADDFNFGEALYKLRGSILGMKKHGRTDRV